MSKETLGVPVQVPGEIVQGTLADMIGDVSDEQEEQFQQGLRAIEAAERAGAQHLHHTLGNLTLSI